MVFPSAVVQSSALGLLLHTDADEGLTLRPSKVVCIQNLIC